MTIVEDIAVKINAPYIAIYDQAFAMRKNGEAVRKTPLLGVGALEKDKEGQGWFDIVAKRVCICAKTN